MGMRARTAILRSEVFLGHNTGEHFERAARMVAIERELERRQLLDRRPTVKINPATDEMILRVHTEAHLAHLEAVAASGGAWLDADTVVRPDSLDVARLAAGAASSAIDAMLDEQIDRAFVIARPPGHHATPSRAMGFCLINTVAVAAEHAIASGLQRVAILDWDVHHGNGTQDAFYGRSDIFFCSIHQSHHYPGTGFRAETGIGEGAGCTLNIPLPAGTTDSTYLDVFRQQVRPAVNAFRPDLIIVSAGYDAHANDPLGDMQVTDEGFRALMTDAIELANAHGGKLLAVLEGGYDTSTLARCVADGIELLDTVPVGPAGS